MINIKEILSSSKVKYGGYSVVVTFVVLAGILVLNLLVGQLGWQADMTTGGVFSLSQQTRDIIRELNEDVTIYVLAARNQEDRQIMEALDLYAQASRRISVQTVDAETNPGFAARFDPAGEGLSNGSVIVASDRAFRSIRGIDLYSIDRRNPQQPRIMGLNVEQRVTNALVFVGTGRTPVIYQTTGHGELNLNTVGTFDRLEEQIRNANFEIRSVNLIQVPEVPDDASILVIARPRTDLNAESAQKVVDFMASGGKVLFALDFELGELANIASILERFGIGIPAAVLIEPDRNFNNAQPVQLLPALQDTSITNPLTEANLRVFTPGARPVTVLETRPRSVTIEPLLVTSNQSFYRTDLSVPGFTMTGSDVPGPHNVAVRAIEREFTTSDEITRLVVVGDSDFITLWDQVQGNLDFLLGTFGWLEQQEQTLTIRSAFTMQFPMNLDGMQRLIFGGLFVIVIPLAILIAGLVVWLRRRHL